MRRENLPAGGHDKVIWKCSRDRIRDKASQQRNSETWWRRTTATLLGVSFGSYRRRRREVLMGRRGYVRLGRLGDVPLRRRWVFHLRRTCDVAETYKETSLWRRHDVSLPSGILTFLNKHLLFCLHLLMNSYLLSRQLMSSKHNMYIFWLIYFSFKRKLHMLCLGRPSTLLNFLL